MRWQHSESLDYLTYKHRIYFHYEGESKSLNFVYVQYMLAIWKLFSRKERVKSLKQTAHTYSPHTTFSLN